VRKGFRRNAPARLVRLRRASTFRCGSYGEQDGATRALEKTEKSEKWFFGLFQLEPAAAQSLPTKIGCGDFSGFSKNFRGCMGGGGWVCTKGIESRLIMAFETRQNHLGSLIFPKKSD